MYCQAEKSHHQQIVPFFEGLVQRVTYKSESYSELVSRVSHIICLVEIIPLFWLVVSLTILVGSVGQIVIATFYWSVD